jgi:ATP-binding protein involved in chromosome partitioning
MTDSTTQGRTQPARESNHGTLPPKSKLDVKHVILVLSGKGGVGKSTVAVNLASALAGNGRNVGILDLDIHGPNVPKMLGIESEKPTVMGKLIEPIHVTDTLSAMSMAFFLQDTSSPVIWRGPMKMTAIRQFLEEVHWGSLDYLIVDLPPGTGDEALTIAQIAPNVRGAVIVTTPQDVAILDATKAVRFIEAMELPILGIIENMSGMVCPHCGEQINLFGTEGGRRAAASLGVPYLGSIPIDPAMVLSGDNGRPFILSKADSPARKAVEAAMENLVKILEH